MMICLISCFSLKFLQIPPPPRTNNLSFHRRVLVVLYCKQVTYGCCQRRCSSFKFLFSFAQTGMRIALYFMVLFIDVKPYLLISCFFLRTEKFLSLFFLTRCVTRQTGIHATTLNYQGWKSSFQRKYNSKLNEICVIFISLSPI